MDCKVHESLMDKLNEVNTNLDVTPTVHRDRDTTTDDSNKEHKSTEVFTLSPEPLKTQ